MSVSRGSGGLLVREGGTGGLWVFLPLLFHSPPSQEGAGRERRLRRLTGPQGLDPSLGGPLQDPTLPCKPQGSFPASLSTHSWDPNPRQRSPSLREGELETILTAMPPLLLVCLSVCLPRCVSGAHRVQLGAM